VWCQPPRPFSFRQAEIPTRGRKVERSMTFLAA
jgi:hypothetical protein